MNASRLYGVLDCASGGCSFMYELAGGRILASEAINAGDGQASTPHVRIPS